MSGDLIGTINTKKRCHIRGKALVRSESQSIHEAIYAFMNECARFTTKRGYPEMIRDLGRGKSVFNVRCVYGGASSDAPNLCNIGSQLIIKHKDDEHVLDGDPKIACRSIVSVFKRAEEEHNKLPATWKDIPLEIKDQLLTDYISRMGTLLGESVAKRLNRIIRIGVFTGAIKPDNIEMVGGAISNIDGIDQMSDGQFTIIHVYDTALDYGDTTGFLLHKKRIKIRRMNDWITPDISDSGRVAQQSSDDNRFKAIDELSSLVTKRQVG